MIGVLVVDELLLVDDKLDVLEQIVVVEIDEEQQIVNGLQQIDIIDDTVDADLNDETPLLDEVEVEVEVEDTEMVELDELEVVIHINLDQMFDEIEVMQAIGELDELDEVDDIDIRELDENDENEVMVIYDELVVEVIEIDIGQVLDDFEL